MRRADTTGGKGRGATIAALIALAADVATPLLPVYGNGHEFVWTGIPSDEFVRFIAQFLVSQFATAIAVLFGFVMLQRHRSAVAAGAFAAVAIVVLLGVAADLIPDRNVLSRWQTALVLGLQTIEATALVAAASISARRWS
jgi:hypothetical protein